MIKMILCSDLNGAIGKDSGLLCHLPKDLEYFKRVTSGDIVLMGSNTYKSLPMYPRGLPNRGNFVLTREVPELSKLGYKEEDGYTKVNLAWITSMMKMFTKSGVDIWIIGGASIYKQLEPLVSEVHLTTIEHVFEDADTFYKPDLTLFEDTLQCTDVSSDEYKAEVRVYRRKV